MNIHLPAILGFTRYQGFDPSPFQMKTYTCTRGMRNLLIFDQQEWDAAPLRTWMKFDYFPQGRRRG